MYVIMYHYVRDLSNSKYPRIKGLNLRLFEKQLEFLKENGFSFVTIQNVVNNEKINEKSVLLTFDDGYIDHYTNVFPILDRYGIKGVFSMPAKILAEKKVLDVNKIHFILAVGEKQKIKKILLDRMNYYRGTEWNYPSNDELYREYAKKNRFDDEDTIFIKRVLQTVLPERLRNIITDELFRLFVAENEAPFVDELYMNLDQIREMKKKGMEFAYHGYDHYWMNRTDERLLKEDIDKALEFFSGIIPSDWICCYPYGSYNEDVINVIKEKGAIAGLSTDVNSYMPVIDNRYIIPRLDTNDFPPKSNEYIKYANM